MKKLILFIILLFTLVSCDSKKADEPSGNQGGQQQGGQQQVSAEKGSLDNPYTIAEALEIIGTDTNYSNKKIYIQGIVEGKPFFNTKYSSYSVYLKDANGTKSVQVYSATLASSLKDVTVEDGDTVIAGGYYTYYAKNSQAELAGTTGVEYPVIYKIIKGSNGGSASTGYESLDDDGRETETITLEFNEANRDLYAKVEGKSYFWRKDNFIFENSAGERIEGVQQYLNPYRLYVQTIVYFSVTSGTIKYIEFATDSNYPFTGDEQVTDGKVEVVSNKLTRIYAKKGVKKVRLRNQNDIENKKQIRVYSVKIVYYK